MKTMKMISSDSIPDTLSAQERELERQIQKARTAVISWLGISRKSSGRITDYLLRQGFDQNIIELTMDSLKADGTIDDERLANNIVRQRQGRQAESRLAMQYRMRRLGLEEDAIISALPDISDDLTAACHLLEKRFGRQLAEQARYSELSLKAARFLAGRGFAQSTIVIALRKYALTIDSDE